MWNFFLFSLSFLIIFFLFQINNSEKFPVRCRLFHYKLGLENAKLSEEYYLDKSDPILEEQKELLEEMPMPELMNDPSENISIVEKLGIKYIK